MKNSGRWSGVQLNRYICTAVSYDLQPFISLFLDLHVFSLNTMQPATAVVCMLLIAMRFDVCEFQVLLVDAIKT